MAIWYYSERPLVTAISADLTNNPCNIAHHIGVSKATFPAQQQGMKMCGLASVRE